MRVELRTIAILDPKNSRPGIEAGVVQVRNTNRGTIVREGAVGMMVQTGDGRRVDILLTPDEARELGGILIVTSYVSADALPPVMASAHTMNGVNS